MGRQHERAAGSADRLWTYVRDERPSGGTVAPAVWFTYTPDRRGEHPQRHLEAFTGILQADGYAGFSKLYGARQERSPPLLDSMKAWLQETLAALSQKSATARAIRYALSRWEALGRYCDDGRIAMDNNAAERALRCVALGRKNFLFAGSDAGGERAAAIYSLLGSAKLNGCNPEAFLREVLTRIGEHPIDRITELLPWNLNLNLNELHLKPLAENEAPNKLALQASPA